MTKTNKKTLEEIIRVDHAGERGAIKIYEGQLLALKTLKQDEFLKKKIEEMKEHEKEHYEYFDNEIKKRNIKPTKLLPLWDLMGVTLGFGTAMLGEKAAMLCTASVEEVIDGHYKDQTYKLGEDEKELKEKIMKFRDDELHHKDIAYDNGATKEGLFGVLDKIIKTFLKNSNYYFTKNLIRVEAQYPNTSNPSNFHVESLEENVFHFYVNLLRLEHKVWLLILNHNLYIIFHLF
jgi:ubiquinone biosynthesis monooxygenase Coq7